MIMCIIKPKAPDICGNVYGMMTYSRVYLVADEDSMTVTIKSDDRFIKFDKTCIIAKW